MVNEARGDADLIHDFAFLSGSSMDNIPTLQSLGLALPSRAYLMGAIVFGVIGFAAYRYGKKVERPRSKWLGVVLMAYPYATSQTWAPLAHSSEPDCRRF